MSTKFHTKEELFTAIQTRKSTRTYNADALKQEHIELIQNYLNDETMMSGPFGHTFKIEFLNGVDIENQIATYGYVKGFRAILMAIAKVEPLALFEMSYILHGLDLQLTQAGVQSVWLGGAFNHKDAINATDIKEGEIIAAVIPLGYASSKKRIIDYAAPLLLGTKNRKAMDDVFFYADFNTPLGEKASHFYDALDLARRAPSAKNKQSWRVVVDADEKRIHLYALFSLRDEVGNGRKQYACSPEYLDLGAFYQSLELGLIHSKFEGDLVVESPEITIPKDLDIEYIATWVQK